MSDQTTETPPSVTQVIADAIGSATWPNGEPFVHLAAMHRRRVAEHVEAALKAEGLLP